MLLETYLEFNGKTEEAIEFYKVALDATVVSILRFKDHPESMDCGDGISPPPDKIMHSLINIQGNNIMASDGTCSGELNFSGFSLSISVDTVDEVHKYFNALATDGEVVMPPTKMFFSELFGMVKDKFGVTWLVLVTPPPM